MATKGNSLILSFYLAQINASFDFTDWLASENIDLVEDIYFGSTKFCFVPEKFKEEAIKLKKAVEEMPYDGFCYETAIPYSFAFINLIKAALIENDFERAKKYYEICF